MLRPAEPKVYYLLEDQLEVWLINAEHLHNVPGRKTDVADSAWIAQMVEHGLVRPSFVPPPPIRELRDLTRHRRTLVEERTRVVQRLEKVMQDAGIKLTSVASALLTKSGRAILEALLAGQDDPDALAELARGRLRAKIPALREALAGRFRVAHHGLLVAQTLAHVDFLDAAIAELDTTLERAAAPFQEMLKRVRTGGPVSCPVGSLEGPGRRGCGGRRRRGRR
jgi:transposase